jgi:hypothetical protein
VQIRRQPFDSFAPEEPFGVRIAEATDHEA